KGVQQIVIDIIRNGLLVSAGQITPEHGLFVTFLIIDPAHILSLVDPVRFTVYDPAARIRRRRKPLRSKFQCGRAHPRGIKTIVDEGRTQGNLTASVACRPRIGSEIAGYHRCRRNETDLIGRILAYGRALITSKKEQLVLYNRPADRSSELVALQSTVRRGEILAGIEEIIPDKLEQVPVKCVGAGLCHGADSRARKCSRCG